MQNPICDNKWARMKEVDFACLKSSVSDMCPHSRKWSEYDLKSKPQTNQNFIVPKLRVVKKKFGKLSLIPDVHITYHKG